MNKFIHNLQNVQYLFDDEGIAQKSSWILKGRSPRLSDIAREMDGNEGANYKQVNGLSTRKLLLGINITLKPLPRSKNCWVKSP